MKNNAIFLLLILINFSCKEQKNKNVNSSSQEQIALDTLKNNVTTIIAKDTLMSAFNLKKILNTLNGVKHTKDKHQDWMFNKASTLKTSLELDYNDFSVQSTSYIYKNNCVFYLHTIKHTNDSISIKSYIENSQGKKTKGYTMNRILIFTMLNDKEANFIDIPEKLNPLKLREELLDTLYKKIDSDIILCNRTKKCIYKDLRKESFE